VTQPDETLHAWERKAIGALLGILTTVFLALATLVYKRGELMIDLIATMRQEQASRDLESQRREAQREALHAAEMASIDRRLTIIEQRQDWARRQIEKRDDVTVP
jgi:hypothetical protein